jgi:hypothetical protein
MGTRVIVGVPGAVVSNGTPGQHGRLIDEFVSLSAGKCDETAEGRHRSTAAKWTD